MFVPNFDVAGIEAPGGTRRVLRALREAGFTYDSRAHRIRRDGPGYTGRPAVGSHYEPGVLPG
ncbi:hypothetical protein AB0F52_39920 [Amycolatopsis sp. NPDC024027]|uniref:hypothetical protein n=1 Tax=Amycolatopsis sp. NPDC024027 TaxID=3154327 RepID=UPI0033E4A546